MVVYAEKVNCIPQTNIIYLYPVGNVKAIWSLTRYKVSFILDDWHSNIEISDRKLNKRLSKKKTHSL